MAMLEDLHNIACHRLQVLVGAAAWPLQEASLANNLRACDAYEKDLGTLDLAKPRPSSNKPRVKTPTRVLFPLSTFPMTATRTSSLGQSELLFLTKISAIAPPTHTSNYLGQRCQIPVSRETVVRVALGSTIRQACPEGQWVSTLLTR